MSGSPLAASSTPGAVDATGVRGALGVRVAMGSLALVALVVGGTLAMASALPIFAVWGATVAVAMVGVVSWASRRGWSLWTSIGRLGLLGALAVLWLGRLLAERGADVDAGLSAWLPNSYSPRWIGPAAIQNLAIALAVLGALALLVSHGIDRMQTMKRGRG